MRRSYYKRAKLPRTIIPRNINFETTTANKLLFATRVPLPGSLPSVRAFSTNTLPPQRSVGSRVILSRRLDAAPRTRFAHSNSGYLSTMATALKIHLSPETDAGIFSSGMREDTARAASEALQLDMERHHVFFNDEGFHSAKPLHPVPVRI